MSEDIKHIKQKKIVDDTVNTKNNETNKRIFKIVIPINNNINYHIKKDGKRRHINCPIGGLIIGNENSNLCFPIPHNYTTNDENNKKDLFLFMVLFLETNL